jgi:Asp-tRNA(Asn)/Glu-tRNA(Gln) amidotransferase A subunit family amidase
MTGKISTLHTKGKAGILELSRIFSSGEVDLFEYYEQLATRVKDLDAPVKALLPEADRSTRIHKNILELLKRYPDKNDRPPLFGIPFGVKDIFHVEGSMTLAGSQLPPELLTGNESVAVTRLKEAGAVFYAKTVTTEFAYFGPGPTRNPHNPGHTPGGSSSGSAAAVGGGILPLATGTQTIGSIVRPAGFCGAVGYKPTYERISREGVIPLSPSVDHIGFFVGSSEDAELVASVLVEGWNPVSAPGMPRLGVPSGPYLENVSVEGLAHFESVVAHLSNSGFELVSVSVMTNFEDIRERHGQIVAAEAARVHEDWFGRFGERYHPKTSELIRKGMEISPDDLQEALSGRAKLREELAIMAKNEGIDLWISPSAPGTAPEGIESTGDPVMNLPWTHAGLPSVSLPSGDNDEGLPFGLQWAKVISRELPIN